MDSGDDHDRPKQSVKRDPKKTTFKKRGFHPSCHRYSLLQIKIRIDMSQKMRP